MEDLTGLPDYKSIVDIKIKGLRVTSDTSPKPKAIRGERRLNDPSFTPGQTLVGQIDLSQLSSWSLKKIVPRGTTPSQVFNVRFIGQVEILTLAQRQTRKANQRANSAGSAMAAAGMAADGGILPSLLIPAISKGVSAVSRTGTPREETGHWYFFNLEVPLDQEGKFAFKIPDEAVIPPTGDTEFGDLHYKLCLVSKTQRLIGEVYNIRLDGHIGAGGKLYTAPSATSATDILSGIIRATATIEHDRLVLVSHPELNFLTVLGTQTVNLSLSPADPSDSKLALLQNAFCDVQAMFVHRISVKGGKESADFVFEPVKSKCSLQSLATAGSLIPMTLTLEISHYHLRFERFSGPFYVTKDPSNPTRAICFFAPPPNAANAAPITPPASPSESSPPEYSDDQMNYLMASEWFVRVKVAVTAESKVELSGIHKASPGSPHEIVLDVPFGMTILRAKQENALPAYS